MNPDDQNTPADVARLSDRELIDGVGNLPHYRNSMEMNGRLKAAITDLTSEIVRFRKSSDKLARWVVALTMVLVVLTVVLVVLTVRGGDPTPVARPQPAHTSAPALPRLHVQGGSHAPDSPHPKSPK